MIIISLINKNPKIRMNSQSICVVELFIWHSNKRLSGELNNINQYFSRLILSFKNEIEVNSQDYKLFFNLEVCIV